jgi:hypothetical protein
MLSAEDILIVSLEEATTLVCTFGFLDLLFRNSSVTGQQTT